MSASETTAKRPARAARSRKAAGRPKESRDKLGEEFLAAMVADFEQGGAAAIEQIRTDNPAVYLRVCASILPNEVKVVDPLDTLTDEQLDARIRQLAALLDLRIAGPEGAGQASGAEEAPAR